MADFDAFESSAPEDLEDPAAGFLADQDKELAELEDDNFGEDSTAQPIQQQQDDLGMFNGPTDTQQTNYDSYENFEEAPQTNGPSDAFSAITQQDQIRAEPEKIRIWREEQQERLEQKDKEEEERKIDMRESAKKELDDWYKHHAEQLEKTKENNRASEAAFVKERDETQPGGEWEKICRLCEFNPKNSKNMKDVSRFRSILLQLKQTPLVR
ncbi:Clathrin light chain B,Clathrin light chain,Clathrin light chain A [Mytilus coruscus]|uniref:Clathrin light chain n=1 Tax=Mytilus coruscus TaxID=42192 RepID=A0A6J8AS28_MYTCO|nr:Clathrin light chain B,Clathrin light chain,Clathrin light chain A [Mytilus coruscus]